MLFKVALKFQVLLSNECYSALVSCDSVVIVFKYMSTNGVQTNRNLWNSIFFEFMKVLLIKVKIKKKKCVIVFFCIVS